jgi:hypothetical protein
LNAIGKNDSSRRHLKEDILRLKRRTRLLNNGIIFFTISAIVTALLVIVAFASAFYDLPHEYGVAILFVIALAFFATAPSNRSFSAVLNMSST